MIFVSKYLVPKGYTGIALYPFVFLKTRALKQNKVLIHHERIHLRQQLELLILPFYLIYGVEFLLRLIWTRNRMQAYKTISFEREAYQNETNPHFLKHRPFWNFIRYF